MIRAIITGATGMVGEGVLHECLLHPEVEAVLVINRKPGGVVHPKLKEIVHKDFFDLSPIRDQLTGYNACYFCLGVSSVGMKADEYYRLTYTLTLQVAELLSQVSPIGPGSSSSVASTGMVFCYVSGAGTDSSEKGRSRWARVKGKTENDLSKLPFRQVYNFRPGFIRATPGLSNAHAFYKYIGWLYPIGRALYPAGFCTLRELGLAMIRVTVDGYPNKIIEGKDIIALAAEK
ncbi:MAG TPA: hypothetical protein VNU72_14280 [Puia sp.]|nr:hypothetical protein [Puia sp.]